MRFTMESQTFGRILRLVVPIARRPAQGVLAGPTLLKLTVEGDRVQATTSDTEVAAVVSAPATAVEMGTVAVVAAPVEAMVRTLPAGPVTVSTTPTRLKLQAGRVTAQWALVPPEEFLDPWFAPDPVSEAVTVPLGEFLAALDRTIYAVASEGESHPGLTGLLVEIEGTRIRVTGTNRSRMAHAGLTATKGASAPIREILPGSAVQHIRRLFRDIGGEARLTFLEGHVEVEVDNLRCRARNLAAASFPNYQGILAAVAKTAVTVTASRVALTEALNRAKSASIQADLSVDGQSLRLQTASSEGETDETVEAAVTVDKDSLPPEFPVGTVFLSHAIDAVDDGDVILRWSGGEKPMLKIEDPSHLDTIHVMAARLK